MLYGLLHSLSEKLLYIHALGSCSSFGDSIGGIRYVFCIVVTFSRGRNTLHTCIGFTYNNIDKMMHLHILYVMIVHVYVITP